MQVESSAAKALSDWQTAFSEQSIQRAKEIPRESGASQIKSSHIRQAALEAIAGLKQQIESKESKDDDRRAA